MKTVCLAAFAAVLPLAAVAQAMMQPSDSDAVLGAALYADNCAACHGANLEGQENWRVPNDDGTLPAPPHSVDGHTWHHGDDLLFNYTKLGGAATMKAMGVEGLKSGMPGFAESLSDAEIWDILAFIKSTWPEQAQAVQKARTDAEQLRGN